MSNADLLLYDKVHMMAARLYNKGLSQAQGRCLSGAIDTLTMCIRLQKDHIDALNLLGLVYWEVGEVGQAIKHWVSSASYKEEDNLANEYLETIQSQPGQLSRCGDTMVLYNKSLQYIAQGSGDIAIISLRKAISQNPNYLEAKALLSLYYITKKEEDKAKELLQEILKTSKDHPKANYYWNILKSESKTNEEEPQKNVASKIHASQIPQVSRLQVPGQGGANTMIQPKPLRGNIIAFIMGAICMIGVYVALIIPSKTGELNEQVRLAQTREIQLQEKIDSMIAEQGEMIKSLENEKLALEKANESLKEEQSMQEQILELQATNNLSKENQWLEAADKLTKINKENLSEDAKAQYEELIATVYPRAGDRLYKDGYRQYQSKKYDEAIELLEKSYIYAKEEKFSDNALYIIGRSYEAKGNQEQANQYYQSTIDNYPGTDGAANAKRRLR